jgi:hypothetical protein
MQASSRLPHRTSGTYIAAVILIAVGVLALAGNFAGSSLVGQAIPMVIGLAFLVVYFITRLYGFLIPGAIMTGLGAGIVAAAALGISDPGAYIVLGLGLGFLAIYAVDVLMAGIRVRWWPVIPGGILTLVAGGMAAQGEGLMRQVGLWSPLLLVVIGIWILLVRPGTGKE